MQIFRSGTAPTETHQQGTYTHPQEMFGNHNVEKPRGLWKDVVHFRTLLDGGNMQLQAPHHTVCTVRTQFMQHAAMCPACGTKWLYCGSVLWRTRTLAECSIERKGYSPTNPSPSPCATDNTKGAPRLQKRYVGEDRTRRTPKGMAQANPLTCGPWEWLMNGGLEGKGQSRVRAHQRAHLEYQALSHLKCRSSERGPSA